MKFKYFCILWSIDGSYYYVPSFPLIPYIPFFPLPIIARHISQFTHPDDRFHTYNNISYLHRNKRGLIPSLSNLTKFRPPINVSLIFISHSISIYIYRAQWQLCSWARAPWDTSLTQRSTPRRRTPGHLWRTVANREAEAIATPRPGGARACRSWTGRAGWIPWSFATVTRTGPGHGPGRRTAAVTRTATAPSRRRGIWRWPRDGCRCKKKKKRKKKEGLQHLG